MAAAVIVVSLGGAGLAWAVTGSPGGHEREAASAGTSAQRGPAAGADGRPESALPGPPAPAAPGDASGVPVVQRPARPEGAPTITVASSSPPAGVDIPGVGISSELQRLRLDASGELEVPTDFDVAGWFAAGPEPGQPGPAVIAGHVDSEDGPAVFHRLGELRGGDEVLIRREDGSTVRFTVTAVQRYAKDAFPTEAVYGPVPGPELRLITCGGPFDTSVGSYRDNVVVYAAAV